MSEQVTTRYQEFLAERVVDYWMQDYQIGVETSLEGVHIYRKHYEEFVMLRAGIHIKGCAGKLAECQAADDTT